MGRKAASPIAEEAELRVLVLAPTGQDAALACRVLEETGIAAQPCADVEDLRLEIQRGAGAVLLTEEALAPAILDELSQIFSGQLPWSDLPVLLFSSRDLRGEGVPPATQRLRSFANVVLLDRPTRKVALASAVAAALRARRRQYESRDLLLELEQGVSDRDRFLAMLGHELRNPLGAILACVELMGQKDPSALRRERAIVHRQTRLLSRLVDDLLDVSRVTSGKIGLERVPVDLEELLERCLQSHAVTAKARRVDLSFSTTGTAGTARTAGDPIRLEQIVNNLLTNALKYTPDGGHVRVALAVENGQAEIRVQDTGVGIDRDVLPRIFDLFTQADATLDRAEGGLGIGLTLVRSLVELHGGSVSAESPGRGEGSTFLVRLPVDVGVAAAAPRQPEPVRVPPQLVLLVEDNEDVRESLRFLLEEVGHPVVTAADGLEGVRVALERRPSVALIDIGLPELDGYAVARRIRDAVGDAVLLVALTGYGLEEDRQRALDAGFDAHLTKPITLDAILKLLERSARGRSETGDARHAAQAP